MRGRKRWPGGAMKNRKIYMWSERERDERGEKYEVRPRQRKRKIEETEQGAWVPVSNIRSPFGYNINVFLAH